MNTPTLLNVLRSEKAASLRKRRKDELVKYRRQDKRLVALEAPKEDEFSLPDEDRFLTAIRSDKCQEPDKRWPFSRCHGNIVLNRRATPLFKRTDCGYEVKCEICGKIYVPFQKTSQAAMAAWRVYRAMCK